MTRETIQAAIERWVAGHRWIARRDRERGYFTIGINLNGTMARVRLVIDPQLDGCLFYVIPDLACPSERRLEASRYLTLANCGLINGNFEMDMGRGEIRYKCYVSCVGMERLPVELIESTARCACSTFKRYADGLSRVIQRNEDANAVMSEIEPRQSVLRGNS